MRPFVLIAQFVLHKIKHSTCIRETKLVFFGFKSFCGIISLAVYAIIALEQYLVNLHAPLTLRVCRGPQLLSSASSSSCFGRGVIIICQNSIVPLIVPYLFYGQLHLPPTCMSFALTSTPRRVLNLSFCRHPTTSPFLLYHECVTLIA